jgi:hypothetical protein
MSSDFPLETEDRKRDGKTACHAKEETLGVESVDKLDIIHGGVCVCVRLALHDAELIPTSRALRLLTHEKVRLGSP